MNPICDETTTLSKLLDFVSKNYYLHDTTSIEKIFKPLALALSFTQTDNKLWDMLIIVTKFQNSLVTDINEIIYEDDSIVTTYHKPITKMETLFKFYKNDTRECRHINFIDDTIKSDISLRNDVANGECTSYKNTYKTFGQYVNGEPHGDQIILKNNKKIGLTTYSLGEKICDKIFIS